MHCKTVTFLLFLISICLSGCGLSVPRIGEPLDRDYPGMPSHEPDPIAPVTASGQIEFEVKKNIYCQLRAAVKEADRYFYTLDYKGKNKARRLLLPDDWGAQVSLSFQVDENSSLNPGVTLNTPLANAVTPFVGAASVVTPQSRSVGLGATLSSTASRTDKFNSYFTVAYLRSQDAVRGICEHDELDPFRRAPVNIEPARSSFLVDELGITGWLIDGLLTDQLIPSYGTPNDPPSNSGLPAVRKGAVKKKAPAAPGGADAKSAGGQDTISLETKFIVVTSGNVTPSWKLVRVSANTGNTPFLAAGRTRTHDLILTIGPRGLQTDNANLALQIGQAVSGGNLSAATAQ